MSKGFLIQVLHSDGTINYLSRVAIYLPPPEGHTSGVVLDYTSDPTKAIKFQTDIYANFVSSVLNIATGNITMHTSTHCVLPLSMMENDSDETDQSQFDELIQQIAEEPAA
jgi:hypothetical protein